MQKKNLYLIDGNSYCYRAFYAIGDLRASSGQPTGAVFGFVNMLNRLKNQRKPDYLAICFDLKGPTLRHEKFADYKIHRKPMPDDLQSQMEIIKDIVRAYGVPIFELPGYEADDIIATLATRFKKELDVFIVSGDKDMLQLVDNRVKIYNPQKKDNGEIDAEKVFERYKITPSQITDLLALTGDSADNIPGVPGIGPKTAAELIASFGSLEKIFANTGKIQQKKRKQLLEEFTKQAILSKELATVMIDAPITISLEGLECRGQDRQTLRKIFQELEFKNLYRSVLEETADDSTNVLIITIETKSKFDQIKGSLGQIKEISFCLKPDEEKQEAAGGNINVIEFAVSPEQIFKIIFNDKLKIKDIREDLNSIFHNEKIKKVGYDLKKSCVWLKQNSILLEKPFFDIMIAAYLLEPGAGIRVIADITGTYLGTNINPRTQSATQLELMRVIEKEFAAKDLADLFNKVEMPLVEVLASMEISGICVDKKVLADIDQEVQERLDTLTKEIYKSSGCEFNINSPKQLAEILFEKLKLSVIKKGKSGPSTNVEVLLRLSAEHVLPAMVLEYRELAKLKSTYILGLLELIDPKTNRIYTTFNQAVTATGRLSSSAPNLQNIPIRTPTGRRIREAFICSAPDNWFIAADYSQIELRVLAHLSKDKRLTNAFKQDRDIHLFTASLIFEIEPEQVTEKMRNLAKRVNFGIIYGMGAYGLARDIGVTHNEAKKFIKEYFKRYPQIKVYLNQQIQEAKTKGYVTTLLNRRRYIPQIHAKDAMQRSFAERTAMNTPIQGTAADLIKVAMVDIYDIFKREKLKAAMLLQVHDELVFEVSHKELEIVKQIVKTRMENVIKLDVPIKVILNAGKNWKDLK
ncbi:MAG: DNA polymerase I [Candidatus Omnitrophota bacterium]